MNLNTMQEIYVVVAEFECSQEQANRFEGGDRGKNFVVETIIGEPSTLESAIARANRLSLTNGECRIARLQFIDDKVNAA